MYARTVNVDSLSDQNPLVKRIRRAVSRGTLTEDGYAVAEGLHLVEEALAARCEIRAVIFSESAKPGLVSDLAQEGSRLPEPRQVSDKTFRSLSSTETPQGVLALVKPPATDPARVFSSKTGDDALVVILDGVQEPGNAGAIVRVAEAFGSTGAIFLKGAVDPFHPRCLRGSAGSAFRLPVIAHFDPARFERDPDSGTAMDSLPALDVYAAMPRAARGRAHETPSIELCAADFTVPCAIIIGGESRGVSERMAAIAIPVHIPTTKVESLNAAVAAGILLYEARRQRDSIQPSSLKSDSQKNDVRKKASR